MTLRRTAGSFAPFAFGRSSLRTRESRSAFPQLCRRFGGCFAYRSDRTGTATRGEERGAAEGATSSSGGGDRFAEGWRNLNRPPGPGEPGPLKRTLNNHEPFLGVKMGNPVPSESENELSTPCSHAQGAADSSGSLFLSLCVACDGCAFERVAAGWWKCLRCGLVATVA